MSSNGKLTQQKGRLTLKAVLILLCLAPLGCAMAQGDGKGEVGNEEVIVVKEYEATIQDAQKVNIQPNIPEVEETKPKLEYSVPAKDYKEFGFETNPLKPIAISADKLERYNSSFIKLGFGSQLSPLVQMAYNDNKTKNMKFGLFYNHFNAIGFQHKNQRYVDDEAAVYFRYFPKTFEVGTGFNFHNYRTHFYSVDTSFSDTTFARKDIRQVFRNYDALVYFRNAQRNKFDIDFKQTINFNYLQETYGKANEWFIAGQTDFSKLIEKQHAILADFNFDISQLKNDSLKLQRNIFRLQVGYGFNNDDWKAHLKFGLALDGPKPFFLLDAHLEKRLYQHSIIAYVDYIHTYNKNSLNSLIHTNNFIWNYVGIKNTQNGDFGIGVKGTAQNLSYNLAFHLNHINNLPLFVNDTLDMRRFAVVYDKNTLIFGGHAEAGYNVKEWLRLSVLADYSYFKLKEQARAWHEPNFKLTFRANYVWKNKVRASIDLYGITSSYALLAGGQQVKIKGTADVNLAIEYIFNKHFTFFGTLNNIAHQKYQRWYGYPSFGINGLAGVKFSF